MGLLQLFTVFLIVRDINPTAPPVTTKEQLPPWKDSPWTVNCMKWIQVLYITTALVKEIGQGMHLFTAALIVHPRRLRVHRLWPCLIAGMQYLVTLAVLY